MGLHRGAHNVELWPHMVLFCCFNDSPSKEISLQHGMVGVHFPDWFVRLSAYLEEIGCSRQHAGVYALSTITLGNELESKFFKILGVVSCLLFHASYALDSCDQPTLTSHSPSLDLDDMCGTPLDNCCSRNNSAMFDRENVLRAMLGNRYEIEEAPNSKSC